MRKIFLIGRKRTGIQSIVEALQILKYPKTSILSDNSEEEGIESLIEMMKSKDICAVMRDYNTEEIKAIESAYPDSTFILTKRPSDIWYSSFVRYFDSKKGSHPQTIHTNKGHYVSSYYEGYNEKIRIHFDGRTWKLLTVNFDGSQGWQSICSYLKRPIPQSPFPHANRSK